MVFRFRTEVGRMRLEFSGATRFILENRDGLVMYSMVILDSLDL